MGKYKELEKIQKLKENGAITEAEFEKEKERILKADNENIQNSNKKKKKGVPTWLIIIVVIVAVIGGFSLWSKNDYDSKFEQSKQKVQQELLNNSNGTTKTNNSEIISKWNATLPLNNTNGLECAVYSSSNEKLYLKYNFGICIVDSNNEVNRYMEGEAKYYTANIDINNAKNGTNGMTYMTATEFENIIK